jgi:Family of unknown function (DUF5362)
MADRQVSSRSLIVILSQPLVAARRWILFAGVVLIVGGVFALLGAGSALFGSRSQEVLGGWRIALVALDACTAVLGLWMGVLLYGSARLLGSVETGDGEAAFLEVLDRLRRYFVLIGISTLLGVLVPIITLLGNMMGLWSDSP